MKIDSKMKGPKNKELYIRPRTLLKERYRIEQLVDADGIIVRYIAWDIVRKIRVSVQEYFPERICIRSFDSGEVLVPVQGQKKHFEEGMKLFLAEARQLAQLRYVKELVDVFDCFTENQTAYIVTEYVRGVKLFQYLQEKGTLEPAEAHKLLSEVIRALEPLQLAELPQGMPSLSNMVVTTEGRVRVIGLRADIFSMKYLL